MNIYIYTYTHTYIHMYMHTYVARVQAFAMTATSNVDGGDRALRAQVQRQLYSYTFICGSSSK